MAKGDIETYQEDLTERTGFRAARSLQHRRYQERRAGSRQADGDRPRRRARHQEARRDDR